MSDSRTAHWQTGEPVTHKDAGIQGFAKWTYPRKSDGKKFLRVQITSGKRAGFETWEDGNWIVGQGPHGLTCRDCGQPFRTTHAEDLWCPPCDRAQQPVGHAGGIRRHRAFLHGTRTPYTPPPPATDEQLAARAEQRRRDDEESPF